MNWQQFKTQLKDPNQLKSTDENLITYKFKQDMPTKKGAGGRQQNYDPHTGRFAKTDYAKLYPPPKPSRKEKARKSSGSNFNTRCAYFG